MLLSVISVSLLCMNVNYAGQTGSSVKPSENLAFDLGVGYLQGVGQEFVYDGNDTISQLNWRIEDAAIVKAKLAYRVNDWLSANISGWSTLVEGQGHMDDYDWLIPNQTRWSHWSNHPDTDLNYANSVDVNLQSLFYHHNKASLGVLLGYQWTNQSFTAKGGCYDYSNSLSVGCFPQGELGIGYQQKFETAYVGLQGHYLLNRIGLTGTVKYGPYVKSRDVDQHYLRNLTFSESSGEADFYSASIMGQYPIRPSLNLFVEATYDHFTNGRADMTVRDNNTGFGGFVPDAAGLNAKQYYGVIGVRYKPQMNA